jgi:hypothetical protein
LAAAASTTPRLSFSRSTSTLGESLARI